MACFMHVAIALIGKRLKQRVRSMIRRAYHCLDKAYSFEIAAGKKVPDHPLGYTVPAKLCINSGLPDKQGITSVRRNVSRNKSGQNAAHFHCHTCRGKVLA